MTLVVERLRSNVPAGVVALGRDPVRLTWRLASPEGHQRQVAYELQAAATSSFESILGTSGIVEDDSQVAIAAPGGALRSREERHFRVRVCSGDGWSPWSQSLMVEAGLLEGSDWVGQAITLPDDPGRDRPSPSPLVRREFNVPAAVVRARLYATALGVHRVRLNGKPIAPDVLAPGWTSYHRRVVADVYDVTALVEPGRNAIGAMLGDGWYRGRLGWLPLGSRCKYGSDVGLLAQLEVDCVDGTRLVVATGPDWRASTGEIRSADLYDGCTTDLRNHQAGWDCAEFDDSAWHSAEIVPFDLDLVEPRIGPPVREVATLPATVLPGGPGTWSVDVGQNIAGWLRISVRGQPGSRIEVRHSEVLEPDGDLHTRALRSARATDWYQLADREPMSLEPQFTFHGFRYAEISGDAELLGVEAVAISSDHPRRATFECSERALNRLHENVVWSQRDNFVSIPTDCPQRDERLGWTGDAQAFAATASTLFDSLAFWRSWLRDLALDQDPVLGVSSVVPDVVLAGEDRFGRAGWADAATIVPMAVFESTGDRTLLAEQLDSMTSWVDSLERRRGTDGLLPPGMQFGDWLDPDAPLDRPWEAKVDSTYLANAFFTESAHLTAIAAGILGARGLSRRMRRLAREVAGLTWERWGGHAVRTQTGCAAALRLAVAPDRERARVAAALADLVREADGAVRTGFLGTPLVLPALAEFGYLDECYAMLLRQEHPSWLYQVDHGATTVWERWDAIKTDGSIHPASDMLSFNHYAYGAVIDWVYRHVAGIAPDIARPGYRHVVFAPKPATSLTWATASVDAAYGPIETTWRRDDSNLTVEINLPVGTTGIFVAPVTEASVVSLSGTKVGRDVELGPGRHTLIVKAPAVADARRGRAR
jgi:alpha-L-rhamnosidase